jgi:DNA-binding transcriptional LysR family regulator
MRQRDDEWRLTGPEGTVSVDVRGVLSTNNHEAVRGAALNGLGIAFLPEYLVVDDLLAGRLERVLPGYGSETSPAYLVYPSRQHLAPRTRVVIDFLTEEVQRLRAGRAEYPRLPSLLRAEVDLPRGKLVALSA